MSSYAAIADDAVRALVRERRDAAPVRRHDTVSTSRHPLDSDVDVQRDPAGLATGICDECGGILFAAPYVGEHVGKWQQCQRCHPKKEPVARQDSFGEDTRRKIAARANGQLMYETAMPCGKCSGMIAFVTGGHCVRCVQAAYERGEYEDVAPVPSRVVVPPLPKPKRIRVYVPKPVPAPKPIRVAPPKVPKSHTDPEWRAKIATAAREREQRRREARTAAAAATAT